MAKRSLQIPILSSVRELDGAPQRFLLFIAFNVVSWQCTIGPALVLLARKIGMPASWVGFLISFMPLAQLLVLGAAPIVTHFGPKRVMLTAWMLRNLIMCSVFLMPLAMALGNMRTGWYVLLGATLGFCLMRALGSGGWFPWLHEVVPESQRGAYFSAEASVAQALNVIVTLGQAFILRGDPGLNRYLVIYAIGIASGLVSLAWMYRVPGGHGVRQAPEMQRSMDSYRAALSDRTFMGFVAIAALCFSCTSWLGASQVLYLRDALGLSSQQIMILMAAGSAGVLLTIRTWSRFAERVGNGPAMAITLSGHSVAALGCLLLVPEAQWTPYLAGPIVVAGAVFGSAFWVSTHRAMLGYIRTSSRVGYSNLWTAETALAMGITPILAGAVIERWGLLGFRACFVIAGVAGLASALVALWLVGKGEPAAESV